MDNGIGSNDAENFGTFPQVGFIKTKDIVADKNIWILQDHPFEPCANHLFLGRIGMDDNPINLGTIGEDEEVTFHHCIFTISIKGYPNLNHRITLQFNHGKFIKDIFHHLRIMECFCKGRLKQGKFLFQHSS